MIAETSSEGLAERRLVLVSNRLPLSLKIEDERVVVRLSEGGLATGMRGLNHAREMTWIGWPGAAARSEEQQLEMEKKLGEHGVVPVHLSAGESQRFYEGVANGVLWPLFHYLIDRVPLVVRNWDAYVRANERFCDVIEKNARDGDLIWIHDYHLMLLPAMLRARLPRARIGFFLHIPFPSSEVFRTLPSREKVLEGMLGADLIGFHSYDYLRHFSDSLLGNLGLETELDRVETAGRSVRLGVFPMGIDTDKFMRLSESPEVVSETLRLRGSHRVEKLLLGVDRLDYTKGLPRKVLAIERLLERSPQWRGKVRLLQVAVPSRERLDAYKSLRREVEELVGHINGAYSTLGGAPIHYLYRSISETELSAGYRAADAMLVTPLRDGMNLVAKEFVASRVDGDGVLVLSELAGAASELGEAVIVNPYDVEALAEAFERALTMESPERRARMATLRQKVLSRPVQLWADTFISTLDEAVRGSLQPVPLVRAMQLDGAVEQLLAAEEVALALDYDGTLVQLERAPELARPDGALLLLLFELAKARGVEVYIVSGRSRETLSAWLGELPIGLVAEHGLWIRRLGEKEWHSDFDFSSCSWKAVVRAVFDEFAMRTPGSLVEEKSAGLAWHYRNATPHLGLLRSRELRAHLVQSLAQAPVSILTGRKVVEVRPQGIDKGTVAKLLAGTNPSRLIAAFGDDRTDEEMFAVLPESALTFCAGPGLTRARFRVDGPPEVRRTLKSFLERRGFVSGPGGP
jgi:trehalose 6-phosphate synthase/phosphatase